ARDVRPSALGRAALAGAWGFTQLAFWLFNAHRHAVGISGTWSFLGQDPTWLPGPWLIWAAVALLGALAAAVALARYDVERLR
ncbi:MAG: hypothetical protein ABI317_11000, partial [Gaiellales bacterium]